MTDKTKEELKKLLGKLLLMMDDDFTNFDSYDIDYNEVSDLREKL